MFYLLNATKTILDALTTPEFLTSIILAAIGFALICLARRITKTIRKTNFIASDDRVYVCFKLIGVILVVIAFVLLMVGSLQ
ncbi:MAG: hypothetical protein ACI4TI_01720 [Christensenellales bacterium]